MRPDLTADVFGDGATIFALATGRGRAGVAVVRVSGPRAGPVLCALSGQLGLPPPRRAMLRRFRDPEDGHLLDEGLALWFPAPGSFTGEDVAEFHLHGGPAVCDDMLAVLARQPDLRPAEAGEFTRRAFAHGRMDLTAVEGLGDLLAAETRAQKQQALDQMAGGLARLYAGWADRLTGALAHMEAAIDFVEEEDVPVDLLGPVRVTLEAVLYDLRGHLAGAACGERLREGLRVAVLGPPNAGKSTLVNALAGRDVAIVTAEAGTTRDVIEVRLDLQGWPVLVADTAGLRAANDPIEQEGISRAQRWADAADLRLVLLDASDPQPDPESLAVIDSEAILVFNKVDRLGSQAPASGESAGLSGGKAPPVAERDVLALPAALAVRQAVDLTARQRAGGVVAASLRDGTGLDALLSALADAAERLLRPAAEAPLPTRARHRAALSQCAQALERALAAPLPELMAEDLRLAVRHLGRLTGRVDPEDLLDRIFFEFCIGK